jgi:peptidoglycan/LPS O-acetylase OafA/YrhL
MKRAIPSGFSIYLDLLRVGAAALVVLSHVWPLVMPGHPVPWPGHAAVVIFFVLSGFVIAHAAQPGLGLGRYARHRIARIYPVALSAALLSVAVAAVVPVDGVHFVGARGSDLQDIIVNMLFLGQSWQDVPLPYDAPFWSLNYEVWYYIIFGLACYGRSRWLLAGALLLAGPKILLLMPVWLLGVLLYRRMPTLDRNRAMLLFLVSAAAGVVFLELGLGIRIREALRVPFPLLIASAEGSNECVGDFLLGVIVALNFAAAYSLRLHLLLPLGNAVRYLSSMTFSMYLFHMPLTLLIWNGLGVHSVPLFFGLLFAGVALLAELTERRTGWYRDLPGRWMAAWPRMPRRAAFGPGFARRDPLAHPAALHADPYA